MSATNVALSLKGRRLLDGVTVKFKSGERVGIIGPNGSGKSTFIKLFAGFWRPSGGQIELRVLSGTQPHPVGASVPPCPVRIGYVSQTLDLWDHLPVRDHLALVAPPDRRRARAADPVVACLDRLGLEALVEVPAGRLSGGQRQRLALARAVYGLPDILLLDEFTSSLDPETEDEVLSLLLRDLDARDRLTLFVSHRLDFVRRYATRILFFDHGILLSDFRPSAIRAGKLNPRIQNFLRSARGGG